MADQAGKPVQRIKERQQGVALIGVCVSQAQPDGLFDTADAAGQQGLEIKRAVTGLSARFRVYRQRLAGSGPFVRRDGHAGKIRPARELLEVVDRKRQRREPRPGAQTHAALPGGKRRGFLQDPGVDPIRKILAVVQQGASVGSHRLAVQAAQTQDADALGPGQRPCLLGFGRHGSLLI